MWFIPFVMMGMTAVAVIIKMTLMTMMTLDDRWGRVRSVVTLRDVAVGEELLVDYGYDLIR